MGFDLDLSATGIRLMYRRLLMLGYTIPEAGNLVASLLGLHGEFKKAWTLKELNSLIFIKQLNL